MNDKFWLDTPLEKMNEAQWESICDGCAKCCLHKFIDDDEAETAAPTAHINSGEQIHYTNIACGLLNTKTCNCTRYEERTILVPDCVKLSKENIDDIFFMPTSCSYRRLHEGRGLPSWHPLLNKGKKAKMHELGVSTRGRTVNENEVDMQSFEDNIVTWPLADLD